MGKHFAVAAAAAAITTLCATPATAEPVVIYQLAGTNRCLADIGTDIALRLRDRGAAVQRWVGLRQRGVLRPHPRWSNCAIR